MVCANRLIKVVVALLILIEVLWMLKYLLKKKVVISSTSKKYNLTLSRASDNKINILLWNSYFGIDDYMFGLDEESFTSRGCKYNNCKLSNNKQEPIDRFKAVVFHNMKIDDAISSSVGRKPEQVYVFVNLESPINTEIQPIFANFFNLTITYEFDADIMWSYVRIIDANGETVGPSKQPKWFEPTNKSTKNESLRNIIRGKNKKVAWFVSNCIATNDRMEYVMELKKYIDVDVYGQCGDKKCDRKDERICSSNLSRDYYFYLAFENSNCVDYVTEKVYQAMHHDTVPIVYGGANYTRFLPPGTYINAHEWKPKVLALYLLALLKNMDLYEEMFWWRDHYSIVVQSRYEDYLNNNTHPFCELCKLLNNSTHQYRSYRRIDTIVGAQKSKCEKRK